MSGDQKDSKLVEEPELKKQPKKQAATPRPLEEEIGFFAEDPKCGRTAMKPRLF